MARFGKLVNNDGMVTALFIRAIIISTASKKKRSGAPGWGSFQKQKQVPASVMEEVLSIIVKKRP